MSSIWNFRVTHAVNMNERARSWLARWQLTCASSHGCAVLYHSGTSPNASPKSLHSDKNRKKDHSPARSSNLVPVSQPVGEALSSARLTESMESPSRQALSASLSMSVTTAVAEVQPALASAAAQMSDKPPASGTTGYLRLGAIEKYYVFGDLSVREKDWRSRAHGAKAT